MSTTRFLLTAALDEPVLVYLDVELTNKRRVDLGAGPCL
jgi:hypothetical protein